MVVAAPVRTHPELVRPPVPLLSGVDYQKLVKKGLRDHTERPWLVVRQAVLRPRRRRPKLVGVLLTFLVFEAEKPQPLPKVQQQLREP